MRLGDYADGGDPLLALSTGRYTLRRKQISRTTA